MKLGLNVAAGFAGSAWSAVIALAVVPFYLRYLGVESYGLVGFFTSLQILLQLLDAGLATTINREVAWRTAAGQLHDARVLLRTVATLYWVVAAAIGLAVVAVAPAIAEHWLGASTLEANTLEQAVMLMGVAIACRWPIALYQGALIGAQRLAVASGVQVAMVTIAHVGAVTVLALWSPTIQAFFVWHAGAALVHALVMRRAAWRALGGVGTERFDVAALRRIWRFSAGMSGTAIAAALLTQIDKVLLSRLLSLEEFGRYALAGVVASGLYVMVTPVFNAVYPRFSALASRGDEASLVALYRIGTRLFCSVLFPLAFGIALFAEDLLAVWTGNGALAAATGPIVALLVLGTALNGVMHFPYALQLAHGLVRLPFLIAASLAVLMVPLTILLTDSFGTKGGAAAWLIVNITYALIGIPITHARLLLGSNTRWILEDIGRPLCVSLIVVGGGAALVDKYRNLTAPALGITYGIILILVAIISSLASFSSFRKQACIHLIQRNR